MSISIGPYGRGPGAFDALGAARWYFDEDQPWYIRNLAFSILPFGGFWLFLAAALGVVGHAPLWVVWALAAAALSFAFFAIIAMYRPPKILKPGWLREEEERRGEAVRGPEHRGGMWMVVDRFGLVMMLVVLGGALLASILMVAIEVAR